MRRAAAQHLGRYAEQVEAELIGREIIPAFQDLTQDGERAMLCMPGLRLEGGGSGGPLSDLWEAVLLAAELCRPLRWLQQWD